MSQIAQKQHFCHCRQFCGIGLFLRCAFHMGGNPVRTTPLRLRLSPQCMAPTDWPVQWEPQSGPCPPAAILTLAVQQSLGVTLPSRALPPLVSVLGPKVQPFLDKTPGDSVTSKLHITSLRVKRPLSQCFGHLPCQSISLNLCYWHFVT